MRVPYLKPFQWVWLVSLSFVWSITVSGSPVWAIDGDHSRVADVRGTYQDRDVNGARNERSILRSGLTFTDPELLNSNATIDTGIDYSPQVTTDGAGHWVAIWASSDNLGGTVGPGFDILVARSTDNGITWTDPAALNNDATADSEVNGTPQVTTDGAGHWVAVWNSGDSPSSTIGPDYDILVACSTDDGATWTYPEPLNNNAATDSENDLRPQVSTDGAGNWVAVWFSEDSLGGTIGTDSDILVARSSDNGASWTDPAPLNNNAATDSGGDVRPQVTTDRRGEWVAVWMSSENLGGTIGTDSDILVARSADNGATWTDPEALNNSAATDSADDWFPQVTTDGGGHWVAAWDSPDSLGGTIGTDDDILVARSSDSGVTWTDPAPLNNNAATDWRGDDYWPRVTTDGAGNWVAVWFSRSTLDGTIGGDWDILVAQSTDRGATWTDPAPLNNNAATDSGDDWFPQITTDRAGHWVAVWDSEVEFGGIVGDWHVLVARSTLPPCLCGDVDGSGGPVDLYDVATFVTCFGFTGPALYCDQAAFLCSDLDGDGIVDLSDFSTLALWYGLESTQTVPDCQFEP